MVRMPPKLSGLVKNGAVVPMTPVHQLPDIGPSLLGSRVAEAENSLVLVDHNAPTSLMTESVLDGSRILQVIGVHLIDPNPLAPRDVYTPKESGTT